MTDATHTTPEAAVVADLARQGATPQSLTPGDLVTLVVPDGSTLEILDLETHLDQPRRKSGEVRLHTAESFGRYVNDHAEDGTALYADLDARKIVAVLNGHIPEGTGAGWGDHRAVLDLRHTPEWQAWTGRAGLTDQVTFAEHIEDRLDDIVDPPGATMLELAQTFQAKRNVHFKSSKRLQSGQVQLTYHEEIDAKAGTAGQIEIPEEFTLGIAPFEGCDPYKVRARLRYRESGGVLKIGYQLVGPDDIVRSAFADIVAEVEADTGRTALRGVAPS